MKTNKEKGSNGEAFEFKKCSRRCSRRTRKDITVADPELENYSLCR
ncbi:hypothetical protein HQ585_04765 [candidate division KSB1 bacterium]|nr:hypothetical protein [candidate division KSB1 bacterium]